MLVLSIEAARAELARMRMELQEGDVMHWGCVVLGTGHCDVVTGLSGSSSSPGDWRCSREMAMLSPALTML